MPRGGGRLTRPELALVGTAAMLVFSRVFGLSLVLPNFRRHYEAAFAVDLVWIGTAFGAYGLTMALMQLPWGTLSDRVGRRPVMLATATLFVLGSVWAAFAGDVWTLIGARLVQGLGAISSVAMALVGESVPNERRTVAMALVGIPAGAGFMLGMMAGPALYPVIGMQGLFLVTAAVGALAALPLLGLRLPVPVMRHEPAAAARVDLSVWALAMAGFTSNFLLLTTLFFLPSDDWRTLLPMLVVALAVMVVASHRIDRSRLTWQPVAAGLVLIAVVAPAFSFAATGWRLWVAGAAFFSLHATLSAVLPSQVSRLAGRRGGVRHGIQQIAAYAGSFVAGPVAGYFAATRGVPFGVAAAVALLVVMLLLVTQRTVPSTRAVADGE